MDYVIFSWIMLVREEIWRQGSAKNNCKSLEPLLAQCNNYADIGNYNECVIIFKFN